MAKRLLTLFLAFVMVCSLLPLLPAVEANAAVSKSTYDTKVAAFLADSRFKHGTAWADNVTPKISTWSSKGCCAYCMDFVAYVYGEPSSPAATNLFTPYTDINEVRAGDIIQMSGHWLVVLERNGSKLKTAEGNFGDKVRVCSDGWTITNGKFRNEKASDKHSNALIVGYHYNFADSNASVSFSDLPEETKIYGGSANLGITLNKSTGVSVTKYGLKVFDKNGNLLGSKSFTPKSSYSSSKYLNIDLHTRDDLGIELAYGTPYKYQFWATVGGTTYNSAVRNFRTHYFIRFNANGGSGYMETIYVHDGKNLTWTKNTHTRTGYTFKGWNVCRSDNTWFVDGVGWCTEAQIAANGYTKRLYSDGHTMTMGNAWHSGIDGVHFTLYAVWSKDGSTGGSGGSGGAGTVVPESSTQVYYPIDLSTGVSNSRILSRNDTDCALVAAGTVESYLHGCITTADKNAMYTALVNKNLGSTSGKPNAVAVQSWEALGYRVDTSFTLQELYDQLAKGYPVAVHRTATSSKSEHWSVVCGYTGSTTKLEESGFIVVDIEDLSTYEVSLTEWKGSSTLDRYAWRRNGFAVTSLSSGVRLAINTPKVIHKTGDSHGVYGYITSNSNLTQVIVRVVNLTTGTYALNKTFTPNAKSFSMFDNLDSQMTFAKWPAGKYYYMVYAKDAAGKSSSMVKYFQIGTTWPKTEPTTTHQISYDAPEVSATLSQVDTVKLNGKFTLPSSSKFVFSTSGFVGSSREFQYWTVERSDGKVYTKSNGWQTRENVTKNGYELYTYAENTSGSMNWWLLDGALGEVDFTFHSIWKVEKDDSDAFDKIQDIIDGIFDPTLPAPDVSHQHSYVPTVVAPTCTEEGYTIYVCTCGDYYVSDNTETAAHSWGSWVQTKAPNELADGVSTRTCSGCGKTETKPIPKNPFTDVKADRFETAILWAYYNGITSGTGDGSTFSPENACTRKQIVTFLWRAAGEPEPKSMVNPFTDVKHDRFEKAILWAYYEGITSGTGDGSTFSPENTCTRKQIATFLWRYHGCPEPASMKNPFTDVKSDRFEKAILWAYCQGITTGTGDGTTFSPENPCTRKQIVTFLYRDLAE